MTLKFPNLGFVGSLLIVIGQSLGNFMPKQYFLVGSLPRFPKYCTTAFLYILYIVFDPPAKKKYLLLLKNIHIQIHYSATVYYTTVSQWKCQKFLKIATYFCKHQLTFLTFEAQENLLCQNDPQNESFSMK